MYQQEKSNNAVREQKKQLL